MGGESCTVLRLRLMRKLAMFLNHINIFFCIGATIRTPQEIQCLQYAYPTHGSKLRCMSRSVYALDKKTQSKINTFVQYNQFSNFKTKRTALEGKDDWHFWPWLGGQALQGEEIRQGDRPGWAGRPASAGRWPLQGEKAGHREQSEQGDQPLVGGQTVQGELAGYHILKYIHLSFQPTFLTPPPSQPSWCFLILPGVFWCSVF